MATQMAFHEEFDLVFIFYSHNKTAAAGLATIG